LITRGVVQHREGALEVHADDRVPVRLGHRDDHPVAQDARVVHHHVQPAERLDGLRDQPLRAGPGGDVLGIRDRLPARGGDLVGDGLGRASRGAAAVPAAAEVVDHHLGTLRGERQGVRLADAVPGAGDNHDAPRA
jgi:hypothetical protein